MPDEALVLPWWAAGYICVVYAFSAVGLWEDWKNSPPLAVGGVLSLATITVFVFSYFNPTIAQHFGWLFVPMFVLGVLWEFTHAVRETERAQEELDAERELNEGEKNFLVNVAVGVNAILVVPGYVFGLKLCIDLILGLAG